MKIRKGIKKDINQILKLLNSDKNLVGDDNIKFPSYYVESFLNSPVRKLFVAEEDKKIIGVICVVFLKYAKQMYMEELVVDKNYRRKGIATALMKHSEELAKKSGIRFAFGFSEVENKQTHKLLGKLNYKKGKKFFFFGKGLGK